MVSLFAQHVQSFLATPTASIAGHLASDGQQNSASGRNGRSGRNNDRYYQGNAKANNQIRIVGARTRTRIRVET